MHTNFQDYFIINDHNVRTRNRSILWQIPKFKLAKDIRKSVDNFENNVNTFLCKFSIVCHYSGFYWIANGLLDYVLSLRIHSYSCIYRILGLKGYMFIAVCLLN